MPPVPVKVTVGLSVELTHSSVFDAAMVALGISGRLIVCTMVSLMQPVVITLACRIRFMPGVVNVCDTVRSGVAGVDAFEYTVVVGGEVAGS